jgi:hypothetical protein
LSPDKENEMPTPPAGHGAAAVSRGADAGEVAFLGRSTLPSGSSVASSTKISSPGGQQLHSVHERLLAMLCPQLPPGGADQGFAREAV